MSFKLNKIPYLAGILFSLLSISCAQQTSPTGGPKDTIPPVLQYAIPKKGQTKYSERKIELNFDELIALNNPKEQIIITPDIEKKYDIKVKKKKLLLEFENPLQDSTTYLINFRDAVQDLTEKNPAPNLKLAFSTGTYIDSLSIRGTITDPLKNAPPSDVIIALYEADTFNIFRHKPVYLTKANKYGRYIIQNLKPSRYFVYAFQDKNRNLIVDSKTESYGFKTQPIELHGEITADKILMVRLDSRDLKLVSNRPYNTYANIKTSKGLYDYRISTTGIDTIRSSYGEDHANIKVYNNFPDQDSTHIRFTATDSLGNKIDSTFYIKFSKKKSEKERFEFKVENTTLPQSTRKLKTTITFTKPVQQINFDSIFIKIDSLTQLPFQQTDILWNTSENQMSITKTLEAKYFATTTEPTPTQQHTPPKNSPWELVINKGAFISVEQDSSQEHTQPLKILKPEDAATIFVTVTNPPTAWIVELLDKSFKLVERRANEIKIKFDNLIPGEYQIRLITDSNGNGQWTQGNFITKEDTENITYYLTEKQTPSITVKANWELGPLLIAP